MTLSLLKRSTRIAAIATLAAAGSLAHATACTGISLGSSSTDDVRLGGKDASACVISNVNAQSGPNGNTSAFSSSFGGGWSLLGKVDSSAALGSLQSLSGVGFNLGFVQFDSTSGLWSIEADKNVKLDLVFALHAGGRTGSFLFDDLALKGDRWTLGSWDIDWVNGGNKTPGYSNLTIFGRDAAVSPVPEPQTWAMFFAGIGVVLLLSSRKKQR